MSASVWDLASFDRRNSEFLTSVEVSYVPSNVNGDTLYQLSGFPCTVTVCGKGAKGQKVTNSDD